MEEVTALSVLPTQSAGGKDVLHQRFLRDKKKKKNKCKSMKLLILLDLIR